MLIELKDTIFLMFSFPMKTFVYWIFFYFKSQFFKIEESVLKCKLYPVKNVFYDKLYSLLTTVSYLLWHFNSTWFPGFLFPNSG